MVALPATPYRGIQEFRYVDHAIFFARAEETRHLANLVAVYRGVMLYGDSGNGKSSLINAGLLPEAVEMGFAPERIRVQPRTGEELVVERIAAAEEGADYLASCLAADDDVSPRVVLSVEAFEQRVRAACEAHRPLLVFDQFEELLTLFEEADAGEAQRRVVALLMTLVRAPFPVKLVFSFREDYLGKVKQLLAAAPELVDQALRLGPPAGDSLPTIIRGPFDHYPGHFERELSPALAERLRVALADRFGTGELSLSEVQTVCLRLWQSDDPDTLLEKTGVQGLLEAYLGEELDAFPPDLKDAAVLLLSEMVTSAGTRNVISAEDLMQRVGAQEKVAPEVLRRALDRLESESKLIRRERRRDTYLYEITSEFLVPWISERRDKLLRRRERRKDRRRAAAFLLVAAILAGLLVWALAGQRAADREAEKAERQAKEAASLALVAASTGQLSNRPDMALQLAVEAVEESERVESRSAVFTALGAARDAGILGVLRGHEDTVVDVAFSPDGRLIASAGWDNTIRLWDAGSHEQVGELRGSRRPVNSVAFSPRGRTLVSAGEDRTIRFWDVEARTEVGAPIQIHNEFTNVAFTPDGRRVTAAASESRIRFWDARTHEAAGPPLMGKWQDFNWIAFSPDGRTLAASDSDDILLWDVGSGKWRARLVGHRDDVVALVFSPDGSTLASASHDKRARLWDVRTGKKLGKAIKGHSDSVTDVAFTGDGRLITASLDESIRVWDISSRRQLQVLRGHTQPVARLALSPDGATLASASFDKTVRLWDVSSPSFRVRRPATDEFDFSVSLLGNTAAFSAGAHRLVSADFTDVILWDSRTRSARLNAALAGFSGVAFSPDGRTVALSDTESAVRLWDTDSRRRLRAPLLGRNDSLQSENDVAFSPDGHTLASGDDERIRMWDVRTGDQLGAPLSVKRYFRPVDLAFSPDGDTLAAATEASPIVVWNVATRRQTVLKGEEGDAVANLAFSPVAPILAAATGDTIVLWDLETQKRLGQPLTGHEQDVTSVAFSQDGRTLASGSLDATVRLWDTDTRRQLGSKLTGHTDAVASVAFSADGRTILSYSRDGTVRRWEGLLWRDRAELRENVCRMVGSSISPTEWNELATTVPYRKSCP